MIEVIDVAFFNLSLALLITFVRFVRGPSLPDRVIALDLIAILSAAVIALYSVAVEQLEYMDVAITLTLIAFLSTVAFARYIQKSRKEEVRDRNRG